MQVHPPQQAGHSNEERADEGNKKITERGRNGRRGTISKRSAIKQKSPKSQDRPVVATSNLGLRLRTVHNLRVI